MSQSDAAWTQRVITAVNAAIAKRAEVSITLRAGQRTAVEIGAIEGVPRALVQGADGRLRVRLEITASAEQGEPVEVRVPIDRVERLVCAALGEDVAHSTPRVETGPRVIRRATLDYGMPAVTPGGSPGRPVGARSSGIVETREGAAAADDTWQDLAEDKSRSAG